MDGKGSELLGREPERQTGQICVQAPGELTVGQSGTLVLFQRQIIWKHLPLPSS